MMQSCGWCRAELKEVLEEAAAPQERRLIAARRLWCTPRRRLASSGKRRAAVSATTTSSSVCDNSGNEDFNLQRSELVNDVISCCVSLGHVTGVNEWLSALRP